TNNLAERQHIIQERVPAFVNIFVTNGLKKTEMPEKDITVLKKSIASEIKTFLDKDLDFKRSIGFDEEEPRRPSGTEEPRRPGVRSNNFWDRVVRPFITKLANIIGRIIRSFIGRGAEVVNYPNQYDEVKNVFSKIDQLVYEYFQVDLPEDEIAAEPAGPAEPAESAESAVAKPKRYESQKAQTEPATPAKAGSSGYPESASFGKKKNFSNQVDLPEDETAAEPAESAVAKPNRSKSQKAQNEPATPDEPATPAAAGSSGYAESASFGKKKNFSNELLRKRNQGKGEANQGKGR
ncbi:MAG: hypothetical protein K0T99_02665, partial [Alphaproteobacteria bacterium]|nr:hypothetical protein [Alphaproteobacteria bacterium]